MGRTPTGEADLVRITVTSATRRVDLVLPGAVPVAELVPELARSVGLLDSLTVHGGYRLVTHRGRTLVGDSGLVAQGVEDGAFITVVVGADDDPPRVYDDLAEAMADIVERDFESWDPAAGRRTALWAGVLLLLVGAGSLLLQHGSGIAAAGAAAVALALVLGAVTTSRTLGATDAAVPVALLGCGYASVAGLMLAWGAPFFGVPVAAAGGAALVAGVLGALGLADGRSLLLPPVVVGAVFLATGLVTRGSTLDPAVVLTTALALVVLAGSVFPTLALAATGIRGEQLFNMADTTGDSEGIDPVRVSTDARVAHQILVAVSATVGVLLILVAPRAVSLGVAGTLVAVLACLVVMLRARQFHTGTEVLVGLSSGVLGLVSVALAVLWLRPDWRPAAAIALEATGAALLVLVHAPRPASVRLGRLADLVESVALLALVPALVVATGLFSSVRP